MANKIKLSQLNPFPGQGLLMIAQQRGIEICKHNGSLLPGEWANLTVVGLANILVESGVINEDE